MHPTPDAAALDATATKLGLGSLHRNIGHGFLKELFGAQSSGGSSGDFWPDIACNVLGQGSCLAARLPFLHRQYASVDWAISALTPALSARVSFDDADLRLALLRSPRASSGAKTVAESWLSMPPDMKSGVKTVIAALQCADEDWTWATLLFESKYMPWISEGALQMCDPKRSDARGRTPLMHAARSGSQEKIRSLLPISDLDAVDNQGRTALEYAEGDSKNFFQALIEEAQIRSVLPPEASPRASAATSARL
jgi:hypothetical protein